MLQKLKDSVLYYGLAAAVRRSHKLGGLKPNKDVFPQLWRPEAQIPGDRRVTLPPEALGEGLSSLFQLPAAVGSPQLASTPLQTLPLRPHGLPCVRDLLCLSKDTRR